MINLGLVSTLPEDAQLFFDKSDSIAVSHLVPRRSVVQSQSDRAGASYRLLGGVLAAHALGLYVLISHQSEVVTMIKPEVAMVVSMVSMAATEVKPEITKEKPAEKTNAITRRKLVVAESPVSNTVVEKPSPVEETAQPEADNAAAATVNVAQAAETKPAVEEVSSHADAEPVIEPPRFGAAYLNNPAPNYPGMARRQGEQGRVLLKVLVAEDGHAEKVQLENSSGYNRLDEAAIEAVKQWTFIPAKRSNQPISAYVLVPIKFSLKS